MTHVRMKTPAARWFSVSVVLSTAVLASLTLVVLNGGPPRPPHLSALVELSGPSSRLNLSLTAAGKPARDLLFHSELDLADPRAPSQDWEVEIVPLRQKNEKAQGLEVWVFDIATPDQHVDWDRAEWGSSGPWTLRSDTKGAGGRVAIAHLEPHRTLKAKVKGTRLTVRLLRHPWSGLARVSVNGRTHDVDLFDEKGGEALLTYDADAFQDGAWTRTREVSVDLPELSDAESEIDFASTPPGSLRIVSADINGRTATVVGATRLRSTTGVLTPSSAPYAATLGLALTLVLGVFVWLRHRELSSAQVAAYCGLAGVALAALWTFVGYPGTLSSDSIDQWGQAVANRYTTWHPPVMAMLMRVTQRFTDRPWLFTFLQASLFWFAIMWSLAAVLTNRRLWLVASGLVALHPVLWFYSVTLWKDVWVAMVGLLATAALVVYVRNRSPRRLLTAVALYSLAACFRQNAPTVLLVPAAVIFFSWAHRPLLVRGLGAAAAMALMLAPSRLVPRLPHVADSPATSSLAPHVNTPLFGMVARLPPDSPDFALVRTEVDGEYGAGVFDSVRANYNEACALYLYYGPTSLGPGGASAGHDAASIRLFKRLAWLHPRLLVDHRLSSLAWWLQVQDVSLPFSSGVVANSYGIRQESYVPGFLAQAVVLAQRFSPSLLMRHWLFDLVLLLSAAGALYRRNWPLLVPAATGLAYIAPFLVLDPCPDWRYQLFNYLLAFLCLAMLADGLVSLVRRRLQRAKLASPEG